MKQFLWKYRVVLVVYGAAIPVAILMHYAYHHGIAKHLIALPALVFGFALVIGRVRNRSERAAEALTITLQLAGATFLAYLWPGMDALMSLDIGRFIPWEFALALYVLLTIGVGAAFKPRIIHCFG